MLLRLLFLKTLSTMEVRQVLPATPLQLSDEMTKLLQKPSDIEGLPGKDHPERWPEGLDKMIERLSKLEFLGLYHEDSKLYDDLLTRLFKFVANSLDQLVTGKKDKSVCVDSIKQGTTALLLFGLAFGDFSFWVVSG